MCSVNHNKKALFIHIPKNGGSYISNVLSTYYGFKTYYLQRNDHKIFCNGIDNSVDKHENKIHGTLMYYKTSNYINKIMGMDDYKWNTYFIFTFIRNPYDRIVSGWSYINKYNIPFKNYLNININTCSYDYWHVFMSQTRHLISNNGKIHNMSFIGKFENLENDLHILLSKLGFTHIIHKTSKKNSSIHKEYISYYDNDTIIKVNELFKEDFTTFDYPLF